MQLNESLICFVVVFCLLDVVSSSNLPSFINPCYRDDPNLYACMQKEGRRIAKKFSEGVPEIGVPSLDPLYVGDINVISPIGDLKIKSKNAVVKGFRNAILDDYIIDLEKKTGFIQFRGNATITSDYTIKGRLLIFPLSGKGENRLKMRNYIITMHWDWVLIDGAEGKHHVVITNSTIAYDFDKVDINMSGLFNNDKVLGDAMNRILNDNWREIIKEIAPPSVDQVKKKVIDIFNQFYKQVAYEDLLPLTPKP